MSKGTFTTSEFATNSLESVTDRLSPKRSIPYIRHHDVNENVTIDTTEKLSDRDLSAKMSSI